VGEGIAFVDDRSPNDDTDATQSTSTARPIFGRVPVGGRRNLLERTEEFDNAVWTLFDTGDTRTANAAVAPNGETTAEFLAPDNTNGLHILRQDYLYQSGVTYTGSCFLKAAGRRYVHLVCGGNPLGLPSYEHRRGVFDLQDGIVVSEPTGGSATIQDVGNGWYRCAFTITVVTGAAAKFDIFHGNTSLPTFNEVSDGNGTDGIYLWGAQLEEGSLTPYQKVVTQHDITEAGVPSIYKSFFDKSDDILPITLPTITGGTVALVGTSGIWIEDDWDFTAGTLNIGPTTIAGLPAGILSVVGDLCAVIINDRAWSGC
jgi:hypothetical protein